MQRKQQFSHTQSLDDMAACIIPHLINYDHFKTQITS